MTLKLAGPKALGGALRSLSTGRPDTALLAVQPVPTPPPNAKFLVAVTPPTGIGSADLVSLEHRRTGWRVSGVRAVLEP